MTLPLTPHAAHLARLAGLAIATLFALAPPASAEPRPPSNEQPANTEPRPWSDASPAAAADVRAGKPFVTFVVVPLCDNDQIDCGASWAGRPGDLEKNLYWGAVFGQRRFFERKGSGWARVERTSGDGPLLERAIYRRIVPRAPWGGAPEETTEQLVVLQAVHGASINEAVSLLWTLATQGGEVRFYDGEVARAERIHVAGYAGHNRLMDGLTLPPATPPAAGAAPIPSFVMACISDAYFSGPLRSAGSEPLVMTRSLMAPEGYVIEAIARALGDNAPVREVRGRAVAAYAQWQRLSPGAASRIFAPTR